MDLTLPADDEGLLVQAISDLGEPDSKIRSWVVVAEWEAPDGALVIGGLTNVPPWTSAGMVAYAINNNLLYEQEEEDAC